LSFFSLEENREDRGQKVVIKRVDRMSLGEDDPFARPALFLPVRGEPRLHPRLAEKTLFSGYLSAEEGRKRLLGRKGSRRGRSPRLLLLREANEKDCEDFLLSTSLT